MPTFVHVTSEDTAKKARRGGIRTAKTNGQPLRGVFAMPVTPNFQISHQWVREMKRWRRGMVVGGYFRIPDAEMVWVGRYNEQHQQMTAAQAAAQVMSQSTMTGVQVIIPRRVSFNQSVPSRLVSSHRAPKPPGVREFNLGFRCVVTVGASSP